MLSWQCPGRIHDKDINAVLPGLTFASRKAWGGTFGQPGGYLSEDTVAPAHVREAGYLLRMLALNLVPEGVSVKASPSTGDTPEYS